MLSWAEKEIARSRTHIVALFARCWSFTFRSKIRIEPRVYHNNPLKALLLPRILMIRGPKSLRQALLDSSDVQVICIQRIMRVSIASPN